MLRRGSLLACLAALAASCVALNDPPRPPSPRSSEEWEVGRPLLQGTFGAQRLETLERTGGLGAPLEQDNRWQYPVVGGGAQWKLGGRHFDLGLEGLLAFGWRSRGGALAAGGGGLLVAVDLNLFVIELFGGPFLSLFLSERARWYAGAGPLMQFVEYEQRAVPAGGLGEDFDRSSSGFGLGAYARTGLEFLITPNTWLGLGARWSDSVVDLGRGMGELDLEGVQFVLTLSNF